MSKTVSSCASWHAMRRPATRASEELSLKLAEVRAAQQALLAMSVDVGLRVSYPLSEAATDIRYVEEGPARGKSSSRWTRRRTLEPRLFTRPSARPSYGSEDPLLLEHVLDLLAHVLQRRLLLVGLAFRLKGLVIRSS